MRSSKISVGGIIDARCTRCRTLTNHTIIALVEQRPVRVRCNTCGGEHGYRPPVEAKPKAVRAPAATKPRGGRAAKDSLAADRKLWEELVDALAPVSAKDYAMTARYKAKELVEHPVFGLGVVLSVAGNKAEILFRDGRKLLRCG